MTLKTLLYSLPLLLFLPACQADEIDLPSQADETDEDAVFTISYTTCDYEPGISGMSRANENVLCWQNPRAEMYNEKWIAYIDFYLVDSDNKIIYHHYLNRGEAGSGGGGGGGMSTGTGTSTNEYAIGGHIGGAGAYLTMDCDVIHTFYEFTDNPTTPPNQNVQYICSFDFETLSKASRIIMVANHWHPTTSTAPEDIEFNEKSEPGNTFGENYKAISKFFSFDYCNRFRAPTGGMIMVGYVDLPETVSKYKSYVIPLRRMLSKLRLSVKNEDGEYLNPGSEFESVLCRHGDGLDLNYASILGDELMPIFTGDGVTANPAYIYPANRQPAGLLAGSDWNYTSFDDIFEPESESSHDEDGDDLDDLKPSYGPTYGIGAIRPKFGSAQYYEHGHVYYSYPSDWFDYSKLKKQCTRKGQGAHTGADHDAGNRYEIVNYDDDAPILADREMFFILRAPYQGKQYYYRVPVNYRISSINDQQCFSESDLVNKVLNLYRVQRNHFYDVTVTVDRPGAATPTRAPYLTIDIDPLIDGGTYDYIYD